MVAPWIFNQTGGKWIGIIGEEDSGYNTYQEYNASMTIVYDNAPTAGTLDTPVNNAVISTTTPKLKVNAGTDTDGNQLIYAFRLWTGSGPEIGHVVNSGWLAYLTREWTVPTGSLRDGTTYCWYAYTYDQIVTYGNASITQPQANCFKVDLRLGAAGPSPTDTVGPVTVNLATGNAAIGAATPTMPTVGGGIGLNFTYNSQALSYNGLSAQYFNDDNLNNTIDETAVLSRIDPAPNFNWWINSPATFVNSDHFMVRWTGYVTVPTSGNWTFGVAADDGSKLWVDNLTTPVVNSLTPGGSYGTINWGTSTAINFASAGTLKAIKLEYLENTGAAGVTLMAKNAAGTIYPVTSDWLFLDGAPMPRGWTMSAADTSAAFTGLKIGDTSVTLQAADGASYEFKKVTPATGNTPGFTPPAGTTDTLALDATGNYTLHGADSLTYQFDREGKLLTIRSALDDRKPAATDLTWTTPGSGPPQLTKMTDPVSGRHVDLTYGPTGCPGTTPSGMLCKAAFYETSSAGSPYQSTLLYYDGSGRLTRVENPGSSLTDFAYDGNGLLSKIRDALAADTGATADTAMTIIAYDAYSRVASVTQPEPTASAARPAHSYSYNWSTTSPGVSNTNGQTDVSIAALSQPSGYGRRVTYDPANRQLTDVNALGLTTTKVWDAADRIQSVTDTIGLKTVTTYDSSNRVTNVAGPAPASWFVSLPSGKTIPNVQTAYDENINGLAASWWDNKDVSGAPKLHTTLTAAGAAFNFGTGSAGTGIPNDVFSGRFTGTINIPTTGNWTLRVIADDGIRLWVDDKQYINSWSDAAGYKPDAVLNSLAAGKHRIRIDYYENTGGSSFELRWVGPSVSEVAVPAANLSPDYGLVTSTIDADGKKTTTEYDNGSTIHPEYSLATATVEDVGSSPHLNLRSETDYETPSSTTYLRRTKRRLPTGAASETTYTYYGDTEARTNPCPAGGSANQSGLLKKSTSPSPASIERETVYDSFARTVATRIVADGSNWTCTTYDSRGRIATVTYPAFGDQPTRTVTYNYAATAPGAMSASVLVTSVTDSLAGTTYTKVDLVGRVTDYWDVWGVKTTTTYDQVGRVTLQDSGTYGTRGTHYATSGNGLNQVDEVKINSSVIAQVTYDSLGRYSWAIFPNGAGQVGNGTANDAVTYDDFGRMSKLWWVRASDYNGITVNEITARSTGGKLLDESTDWTDPSGGNSYDYDTAGRLKSAALWGHNYSYGYDTTTGCANNNANKNGNRTWYLDSRWDSTYQYFDYCYDNADRLTTTTDTTIGTLAYDNHGNTTTIAGETHAYDIADRHVTTNKGQLTVAYLRDASDRIVKRTSGLVTKRAVWSGNNGTGATTISVTRPTGTQTGDVILAAITTEAGETVATPSGWTATANANNASTVRTATFWHVAAGGDPSSWAFTLGTSKKAAAVAVTYSGVDTSSPIDVAATATAASTTSHAAPSVTTTAAWRHLVNIYGITGLTSLTPPNGSNELADQQSGASAVTIELADTDVAATGATGTRTAVSAAAGSGAYTSIALKAAVAPSVVKYSYLGAGDSSAITIDNAGTLVERAISLPGGALYTKRPGSTDVWSYPNLSGHLVASADSAGTKIGDTILYDPDGNALNSHGMSWTEPDPTDPPDNSANNLDYGWHGQAQRPLEHATGLLPMIEMGARQYNPRLGRFIEVDPVEGGSANDYDYCDGDPLNCNDLNGQFGVPKFVKKAAKGVASVGRTAWKYRDEIALTLAVASTVACAGTCAFATAAFYSSIAISAASTSVSCVQGARAACAVGIASIATAGVGRGMSAAGARMSAAGDARMAASRWHPIQRGITGPMLSSLGGRVSRVGLETTWVGNGLSAVGAYL